MNGDSITLSNSKRVQFEMRLWSFTLPQMRLEISSALRVCYGFNTKVDWAVLPWSDNRSSNTLNQKTTLRGYCYMWYVYDPNDLRVLCLSICLFILNYYNNNAYKCFIWKWLVTDMFNWNNKYTFVERIGSRGLGKIFLN